MAHGDTEMRAAVDESLRKLPQSPQNESAGPMERTALAPAAARNGWEGEGLLSSRFMYWANVQLSIHIRQSSVGNTLNFNAWWWSFRMV